MTSNATFHELVSDYRQYERQIERLHSQCRSLEQCDVSLTRLNVHRSALAKILARTVSRGEYLSGPARRKIILAKGKRRIVFQYRLTDLIVHGAVADGIAQAANPRLSRQLYSYRKGTGWWTAVSEFARYLRQHRNALRDPRQRHMYVLRRDIDSYTDSIPVGDGAPIWGMLRELLNQPDQPQIQGCDLELLKQVIRPEIEGHGKSPSQLDRGVPTGQPISCVLFNFYLTELDQQFEAVPGAFYARYSDDLLFAHPSAVVVRRVAAEIAAVLDKLGLRLNETKNRDLYLTGAGRASSDWPEATPTSAVTFMGMAVQADGTVALGRKKTRQILQKVKCRTVRVVRSLPGADTDELGQTICATVNQMLASESRLDLEASSASLLRRAVTDRKQLAQLDHWIARIVLHAVTGDPSVKAFRKIPFRKLREEWNLISLEHLRNRDRPRE